MSEPQSTADSIGAAVATLRASGYRVLAGQAAAQLAPEWLRKFAPDFVAERGQEHVVLAVKRRATAPGSSRQLAELAAEVSQHPGWSLELLWLGDGDEESSVTDVTELIARAERVLQVDVEAALLLLWSAVEASLQLLANRVGIRETRPKLLLSELYSLGWLSERHFAELDDAQETRNAIAHRVGRDLVDSSLVVRVAQLARRLADPQYTSVDQMVEWFKSGYMDPANGVPFDSREGGYIYVGGGPYDALDVLSQEYPDALPDELEDAATELEHESTEWVRVDEY